MNATSSPIGSKQFRFTLDRQSRRRKLPVVGSVLDELVAWLRHAGYTESTIRTHIDSLDCLVRWLKRRSGPALRGLTQLDLNAAYDWFQSRQLRIAHAARILGRFFRDHQIIPNGKEPPLPASEQELETYGEYLRQMRGLAESTIAGHQNRLRFFLKFLKCDQRPSVIGTLQAAQIDSFLRQQAKTNNRFTLQHIVAALRSFLRHQYAQGVLKERLHQGIDTPRTYRLEQLPRALPWEQVAGLLRSIDRSQPASLRDFTILYLAARYGLRSGELVRLRLDDVDWRRGVLKVHQTKNSRILRLPLTDEAGALLTSYLKSARPSSPIRELFLRRKAPHGPLKPTAVYDILEGCIRRSGLDIPKVGAHALRHSLAVHLLRQGVGLSRIGDVLGHGDPESTSVYLRLAVDDLRAVGLPVPQGRVPEAQEPNGWKLDLPRIRPLVAKPLSGSNFRSGLAGALRRYLEMRRALGRRYATEEVVLRRWDDFLRCQFGKIREVHSAMFQSWIQTMPHLTPTVRRSNLRTVRNFLIVYARQHPNTYIPDLATFPKNSPHRPPRLVSVPEMARVLELALRLPVSHQNPLRPQTIRIALLLLFCCGLRRGELLRLQWCHCDPRENVLRIEATKFHKSRVVPLSPSVAETMQGYRELRLRQGVASQPNDYLIWSDNPLAAKQVYSAIGLQANWQKLCVAAGILDERGRPPRLHDLRHSCAVAILERWYEQGVDLSAKLPHLATYLGHVSPASTHYYLHLTPQLREAANRRFHDYAFHSLADGGSL